MNSEINDAVIVDAVRSPMGTKNGKLIGIRADDLTAQVIRALLERNRSLPVDRIDDIVLGCAFPEGVQGFLAARGIAVLAGIPKQAGAKVVNRFCGSSMDAVHQVELARDFADRIIGLVDGKVAFDGNCHELSGDVLDLIYHHQQHDKHLPFPAVGDVLELSHTI